MLLNKIKRSINRIKTEEMAEYDLKSPHVSCLYYIYKRKALTVTELCEISTEDKAAVSRSIDYLIKNGFVMRKESEKKRYRAPLALTERGERIAASLVEKIDSILERAGEGVSEEQREILYTSLSVIEKNLTAICGAYEDDK